MTKIPPILTPAGDVQARIDARLARFGDMAGVHGSLAATSVRLTVRIPRDTNLRLVNLAQAIPMRAAALHVLALDTVSRIEPADFFAVLAQVRKHGRE